MKTQKNGRTKAGRKETGRRKTGREGIRRSVRRSFGTTLGACLAFNVLGLLGAGRASAEVSVAEFGGWKLSLEGRLNSFASYGFGDTLPLTAPENGLSLPSGGGLDIQRQQDADGQFHTTRLRNGFLANVLTFNLRRKVTETTTLLARLSLWSDIETNLQRYSEARAYMQEGYMRFEGPWGSFLAGRALGLMSRGSVEIDFNYGHGFGMGYPCNIDGVYAGCGMIGFGVLFPFFASGMLYTTPSLGGLTFAVGAYDPVILAGKWERVGLPRLEAEVAFTRPLGTIGMVKLFSSVLWERLGANAQPNDTRAIARKTVDASGVAGGARLELGPVRVGVAAHYGKGLGFYYALENSESAFFTAVDSADPRDGDLRTFRGFYGQMMLVLGKLDLAGGVGASQLIPLGYDDTTTLHLPRQNLGFNGGAFLHLTDYITLAVDVFRGQFTWWGTTAHQNVTFVNSGITVTY